MTYGTLIATQTIATSGTIDTVTFSSIPQTYTDLVLTISGRASGSDGGGVATTVFLQFNGTLGSCSSKRLIGSGSAASSASNTGGTNMVFLGELSGSGSTANTFGSITATLPNYASSSFKPVSSDSVSENNATAAEQNIVAGLWSSTSAITSLSMVLAGFYQSGSTVSLYGLTHF